VPLSRRREGWRLASVFLLAALVWIVSADRTSLPSWQEPTIYSGDAHEVLARIKAASEGDLQPLRPQEIQRLGAPFGANWNAYPTPEKIPLFLLGGIARVSDVFVAANVGLMLGFASSALAFYWVVRRWLRAGSEWAAMGALLFAFHYATVHRGLAHFSFVLAWVVPLGLLACWLVAARSPLRWGSAGMWVCFAAAVLLGWHNTYYLFFWLPLIAWACLAQAFGARRRSNLTIGLATVAVALGSFFLANLEHWVFATGSAARPLLERNFGGTERYALRFVELFIPPDVHRADWLGFLGQRYARWSEFRGEAYLPYLGLVGGAALIWLLALGAIRLLRGRRVPGPALTAGWLLAFGTMGGLTSVLAFFGGFFVFRATNRIGVYLAAVALVFLVVQLTRLTRGWSRPGRILLALALLSFGLLDQIPRGPLPAARAEIARVVESDRAFGAALEARLPQGSMVFQLPALPFPEANPPWRLNDYEHFRPFLTTETLRFSYGSTKFRPRMRWQLELEQLPPLEMVQRLEQLGFAGLYLNRKGFEDGAEDLLRQLLTAGYRDWIQSPLGHQVVVVLRPAPYPELPFAASLTVGRGWHNRPVDGVRWAFGPATLLYFNPLPHPVTVDLTLRLRTPDARAVTLRLDRAPLASVRLESSTGTLLAEAVTLTPGTNVFHLESGPAVRNKTTDGQLRAFGLEASLVVRPAATASSP